MKQPRRRAQPLRSLYATNCVRCFVHLTSRQTTVLDYAFDKRRASWRSLWTCTNGFSRNELLSLVPDKWVSSYVVSMMARTLTAVGSHRFTSTQPPGVNRKALRADIVVHFARFFRSNFMEFELTG